MPGETPLLCTGARVDFVLFLPCEVWGFLAPCANIFGNQILSLGIFHASFKPYTFAIYASKCLQHCSKKIEMSLFCCPLVLNAFVPDPRSHFFLVQILMSQSFEVHWFQDSSKITVGFSRRLLGQLSLLQKHTVPPTRLAGSKSSVSARPPPASAGLQSPPVSADVHLHCCTVLLLQRAQKLNRC